MRQRILSQSMESVAFQSTKFFDELTECFEALWKKKYNLSYSKLIKTPEALAILECAERHTKMKFFFSTRYVDAGPGVCCAPLNPNHIFFDEFARESKWFADHFKEIYGKTRKTAVFGSVNLKEGTVGGAFEDVENELLLPTSFLASGRCVGGKYTEEQLTAQEAAAITLHEFGHAYTYFEYTTRLSTGNQVLAYLAGKLAQGNPEEYKVALINADRVMHYSEEQRKVLAEAKDGTELAILSIAVIDEKLRSEVGLSLYDITSCEQLADQYANRMGAGLALMTGLEKIGGMEAVQGNPSKFDIVGEIISYFFAIVVGPFLGLYGMLIALITFSLALTQILTAGQAWYEYDDSHHRPLRVRSDMVERLKDKAISHEEKQRLIGNIETLDKIIEKYHEYPSLMTRIALLVKSSYRKNYNFELLQKQLETMANNSLFVKASKLETLHQPTA